MEMDLRKLSAKAEVYRNVASYKTLLNTSNHYSLLNPRYRHVRSEVVRGIGPVYLAEKEKTVILTPVVESWIKQSKVGVGQILDLVQKQISKKNRTTRYTGQLHQNFSKS